MPPRRERGFDIAAWWVREGVVPGLAIAVGRHGELIREWYGGKQSAGSGRPVDASTLFSVDTITRVFTATALMRLVERGAVGLDEPVRRLFPILNGPDKREISLRHLLSHTAGFPATDPAEESLWSEEAGRDQHIASAAALPLVATPGARAIVSTPGYWIAGALAEAVTGAPFAEVLRAEVLEPFGLTDTVLQPGPEHELRIARRYGRGRVFNTAYGRALGSPAAGLFATARDLVRFAGAFTLAGQTPEGERVLSAATVEAMVESQTGDLPVEGAPFGAVGLGWGIKGNRLAHETGDLTSSQTILEIGQSGCLLWADPASGLAVAALANRELATGWVSDPPRWARLCNAIVADATREPSDD